MVPNHARYQLRYTPKSLFIIMTVPQNVKRKVAKRRSFRLNALERTLKKADSLRGSHTFFSADRTIHIVKAMSLC